MMGKSEWIKEAEARGKVADSMTVRLALLSRVKSGEISLEQAQEELAKIKREAKKNGQLTRNQAFHGIPLP